MNTTKTDQLETFSFLSIRGGIFFLRRILIRNVKSIKLLVKFVGDYTEVGLIFSYHSQGDEEQLKAGEKTNGRANASPAG